MYDYNNNGNNVAVYKVGRLCFITCASLSWWSDGVGEGIRGGIATSPTWTVPSVCRPVAPVEIREALNGKRITIGTSGLVYSNEALTNVALRFSGCYVCN